MLRITCYYQLKSAECRAYIYIYIVGITTELHRQEDSRFLNWRTSLAERGQNFDLTGAAFKVNTR